MSQHEAGGFPGAPVRFATPPEAVGDRARRFLEVFAAILKHSNYAFTLDHFAGMGTECGRCTAYCHVFKTSGRLGDAPCYRSELLLRTYRRHFSAGGWLQARVMGASPLTDAEVDEMAAEFYRCNACSRCSLHCPMGVDHGFVTHLARYILSEMGIYPEAWKPDLEALRPTDAPYEAVSAAHAAVGRVGEALSARLGRPATLPFDQPGCEYVFFPASFGDPLEVETVLGQLAILQAAGASWTLSTRSIEPLGKGVYCNDSAIDAAVAVMTAEVRRLGARAILVGESGHTYRLAKLHAGTVDGGKAIPVASTMEITAAAMAAGTWKPALPIVGKVTYHDPCQVARWGWLIGAPRQILKGLAKDYVELSPKGRNGFCCGGGGGTAGLPESREFRMQVSGRVKADQIRASGARIVASSCACCRAQIRELAAAHGLEIEVAGVHELVLRSMVGAPAVRIGDNLGAGGAC